MSTVSDKCFVCRKPLKRDQIVVPIQRIVINPTFGKESVTIAHAHIEHVLNTEQAS